MFIRLGEIGDDFAVVPEQFVAEGDTVVALGDYRWKHKRSGEPSVVKMVHVWSMDGGKAVAFQQHGQDGQGEGPPLAAVSHGSLALRAGEGPGVLAERTWTHHSESS